MSNVDDLSVNKGLSFVHNFFSSKVCLEFPSLPHRFNLIGEVDETTNRLPHAMFAVRARTGIVSVSIVCNYFHLWGEMRKELSRRKITLRACKFALNLAHSHLYLQTKNCYILQRDYSGAKCSGVNSIRPIWKFPSKRAVLSTKPVICHCL